jgi:serine phosphatase RsbU (regulator of sigma subunit)
LWRESFNISRLRLQLRRSELEQLLRTYHAQQAGELSEHLMAELRNWRPKAGSQQDDITVVVVIDVL